MNKGIPRERETRQQAVSATEPRKMVTRIPLADGTHALVDDEDAHKVSELQWWRKQNGQRTYARTRVEGRLVYMHVLLLDVPEGFMRDHRDGDGLNNTRENLRIASPHQNQGNRRSNRESQAPFKGISWDGRAWRAQIRIDGRKTYLGRSHDPEIAARLYDNAARSCFGEFARTNFPATERTNVTSR